MLEQLAPGPRPHPIANRAVRLDGAVPARVVRLVHSTDDVGRQQELVLEAQRAQGLAFQRLVHFLVLDVLQNPLVGRVALLAIEQLTLRPEHDVDDALRLAHVHEPVLAR